MATLAHAHPPHHLSPHDDDDDQDVLIQFGDNAFEGITPIPENFEQQVREAQEQLALLRQREEQLERQKRELEELHQKKEAFTQNRATLTEELSRAIAAFDREADESQRRADQCANARQSLEHYLRTVESLRPDQWGRHQLKQELTRAQSQLAEAEDELNGVSPLLGNLKTTRKSTKASSGATSSDVADNHGFLYWFRSGLAFTLPVMIFAAVFGLLFLIFSAP